jgi:hypothetical protein
MNAPRFTESYVVSKPERAVLNEEILFDGYIECSILRRV